ncbi:MAG TPA: RodZ domain-containing protein [Azospirillum sp.]|nr:RodZ domain-containing protein [Azospirillum sp.]HYD68662.1 RodZ domain-containing protein [Azospirillum sp.]
MGERKKFFSGGNANAAAEAWNGAPAPESVATVLRDARLRLGVELRDVAATLRIRYPYLEAIEQGRYAELPGTAYATGFLRSYAEFLGLDQDDILRRYKDEVAGRVGKQELYFPTPVSEGRVPGGGLLFATVLLGGLVYGGWYYLSATDRSVVDLVPALPDRFVSLLDNLPWNTPATPPAPPADGVAAVPDAAPTTATTAATTAAPVLTPAPAAVAPTVIAQAPAPVPAAGGASSTAAPTPPATPPAAPPAVAAPAPTAPIPTAPIPPRPPAQLLAQSATQSAAAPAPQPAPPQPAVPQQMVTAPQAEDEEADMSTQEPTLLKPDSVVLQQATAPQPAAATTDKPVTEGKVYGSQNAAARVQIRAVQDSWVQVREPNGEKVLERVLKAGDVFRAPDKPGLRLRTGNAGGLVMIVDGVEGKPLGSIGQVLRDVPLDGSAPRAAAGR